ncbi:hypothetical protein Fleli_1880 [Bernardetia litoralis DSM 6794]|uniref:Uncharacterized protein n=1 Tax=Bernardetia litoralis (strain ATCC 23117 / DSM 6794 / NBRC 15988 / NCIMB 1366 / Fx l1 / Sio-4) TaxID=880071 RepID=I4AJZ0_BERLS|nr:hypothetical protein [Bernardetia litoralis]AFM04275.1 hypothetical protein Fleli_1880 [Bernardetia litoralis DSM 6794]
MKYTHKLTSDNYDFIGQNRTDPITGEKIEEGHTVVICAACKSAFFIESWEYLGDSHCDQTSTLANLPKPQNLYLKTNLKYTRELLTFGFSKKPMFMTNDSGCGLFVFAFIFSTILGIIIGTSTNHGGVGILTFVICIVISLIPIISSSTPYDTKDKSIKEIENANTKYSICIDYKNKGLLVINEKTKDMQTFFAFEDIIEFKYHVMYHPSRDIDALFCQLQIKITTRTTIENYFATIHRDTIPEWSNFISKLPTDMRMLNTPFVNEYNS